MTPISTFSFPINQRFDHLTDRGAETATDPSAERPVRSATRSQTANLAATQSQDAAISDSDDDRLHYTQNAGTWSIFYCRPVRLTHIRATELRSY